MVNAQVAVQSPSATGPHPTHGPLTCQSRDISILGPLKKYQLAQDWCRYYWPQPATTETCTVNKAHPTPTTVSPAKPQKPSHVCPNQDPLCRLYGILRAAQDSGDRAFAEKACCCIEAKQTVTVVVPASTSHSSSTQRSSSHATSSHTTSSNHSPTKTTSSTAISLSKYTGPASSKSTSSSKSSSSIKSTTSSKSVSLTKSTSSNKASSSTHASTSSKASTSSNPASSHKSTSSSKIPCSTHSSTSSKATSSSKSTSSKKSASTSTTISSSRSASPSKSASSTTSSSSASTSSLTANNIPSTSSSSVSVSSSQSSAPSNSITPSISLSLGSVSASLISDSSSVSTSSSISTFSSSPYVTSTSSSSSGAPSSTITSSSSGISIAPSVSSSITASVPMQESCTLVAPLPVNSVCGSITGITELPTLQNSLFDKSSPAECAALCAQTDRCLSFGFVGRKCALYPQYAESLNANYGLGAENYVFYDESCFSCQLVPIGASSTDSLVSSPTIILSPSVSNSASVDSGVSPSISASSFSASITPSSTLPLSVSASASLTSSSSSGCTLLPNPPASDICTETGFYVGEGTDKLIETGSAANKRECAASCTTTIGCLSFGFSVPAATGDLGVCNLYKSTVSELQNDIVQVDPVDGQALQRFFDIGCFDCPTPVSQTSPVLSLPSVSLSVSVLPSDLSSIVTTPAASISSSASDSSSAPTGTSSSAASQPSACVGPRTFQNAALQRSSAVIGGDDFGDVDTYVSYDKFSADGQVHTGFSLSADGTLSYQNPNGPLVANFPLVSTGDERPLLLTSEADLDDPSAVKSVCRFQSADSNQLTCTTGENSLLYICSDYGYVETGPALPTNRPCAGLVFNVLDSNGDAINGDCPIDSQSVNTAASASISPTISVSIATPSITSSALAVTSPSSTACVGSSTFQDKVLGWETAEYDTQYYSVAEDEADSTFATLGGNYIDSSTTNFDLSRDGTLSTVDPQLGRLVANIPSDENPTDDDASNSRLRFSPETDVGVKSVCSIGADQRLSCITGANLVLYVCRDNGYVETGAIVPTDRHCSSLTFQISEADGTPSTDVCPTTVEPVPSTISSAIPSVTSSLTVSATSSAAPCPSVLLRRNAQGASSDGDYSVLDDEGPYDVLDGFNFNYASQFSLDQDGALYTDDAGTGRRFANVPSDANPSDGTSPNDILLLSPEADIGVKSFCSSDVPEGGNAAQLTCVTGANLVLYVCDDNGLVETGAVVPTDPVRGDCDLLTFDILNVDGTPVTEAYCPVVKALVRGRGKEDEKEGDKKRAIVENEEDEDEGAKLEARERRRRERVARYLG